MEIKAKAKIGRSGNVQHVRATVAVPMPVEVELFEDGTFELCKTHGDEDRVVHVSADHVEGYVGDFYGEDLLAEAYEEAVQLQLDPDSDTSNELEL